MTKEDQGLSSNYDPIQMVNSVVLNISCSVVSKTGFMKLANHYMLFVFTSLAFFGIVILIMLKPTQNTLT